MFASLPSAAQHELDLRQLFDTLRCFGLVLNINKCIFGTCELEFLGHHVSPQGITPLPEKVEAVQHFECPRTVKALQCFLRLVNFYRRFLPNIAATMRPRTEALAGVPRQLVWNESMMSAFSRTKQCLAEATLLFHPTPNSASTQTRAPKPSQARSTRSSKAVFSPLVSSVDAQRPPNHTTCSKDGVSGSSRIKSL